jgi:hypothetical protein
VCASDYGLDPIPYQKRTRSPRRWSLNGDTIIFCRKQTARVSEPPGGQLRGIKSGSRSQS